MTDIARDQAPAELTASSVYAVWLRMFAVLYDPFLWLGEIAGMRRRRRRLLAKAYGRVVEIGSGTGLNVALYTDAVGELVLTEPEPGMRRKLERRLQRNGLGAQIFDAPAQRLPVADASVDTVVSTLVLCTVDDPERSLARLPGCCAPVDNCCSSNMSARARGSSRHARTSCSWRGAASQADVCATARPST